MQEIEKLTDLEWLSFEHKEMEKGKKYGELFVKYEAGRISVIKTGETKKKPK